MPSIFRTIRDMVSRKPEDRLKEEHALKQAYYEVFRSDKGQIVLADILRRGYVDQSTFTAGDPNLTSFKEGQRRLCLEILNLITVGPDEEALIRAVMANQTSEVFKR